MRKRILRKKIKTMTAPFSNFSKKKVKTVSIALFLMSIIIVYGFGDYGISRMMQLKNEVADLEIELEFLEGELERLDKESTLVNNSDPEYLQKIAREKYGLVKKGEKIYKLVPSLKK